MKRLFIIASCCFAALSTYAQRTSDALLFSQNHPVTNARAMALGNAMGALGGDLSNATMNPAGLGLFRRTELSVSVGGLFNNTETNFLGNRDRDRNASLMFGSAGLVAAIRSQRQSNKWRFFNFGLTYSRIADYHRTFTYQGLSTGSRVQSFAENSEGVAIKNLDPYEGWMAYHGYLMDSVGQGSYRPNGGITDSTLIFKYQNVARRGGANEFGLSFAVNYDNRLYLGATLGISILNMEEDRFYQETADGIDFQTMNFIEQRRIQGTGINLKLGMIYRLNKMVRFGLGVHTPTVYRLTDSYNTGLFARINYAGQLRENNFRLEDQDPIVYQHNLAGPWVVMGSLGVIIPKRGFIGLDVQYADFSSSTFSLLENDQSVEDQKFMDDLNDRIQNAYRGTLKIRLGGEMALGIARFRLGYQLETSPFATEVEGVSDLRHDISLGAGVRWKHFLIDIAYVHTIGQFAYNPYISSTNVQSITGTDQTGFVMLTIGTSIFRSSNRSNNRS